MPTPHGLPLAGSGCIRHEGVMHREPMTIEPQCVPIQQPSGTHKLRSAKFARPGGAHLPLSLLPKLGSGNPRAIISHVPCAKQGHEQLCSKIGLHMDIWTQKTSLFHFPGLCTYCWHILATAALEENNRCRVERDLATT